MKRRFLLKTTIFSALSGALTGAAMIAPHANAAQQNIPPADEIFFDERFALAKTLATRQPHINKLTAVQSDVTDIWTCSLSRLSQQKPLFLHGVTTESFYFCLKTLLESNLKTTAQIERVSKDLYAWSIETALTNKTG